MTTVKNSRQSSMEGAAKPPSTASSTVSSKPARVRQPAILHLCADLEAEDPARETVDLAILSQRSGWPAIIVSSGGALVQESERTGVPHRLVPLHRPRGFLSDWRVRRKLDAVIQKERPRLIHAHGFSVLAHAIAVARMHHLPLVVDIMHPVEDNAANRRLLDELMALPSYVRVPTEYMGLHLHSEYKMSVERIFHIPSGIDLHWFSTAHVTPERLGNISRAWRLPEQGAIILVPLPFLEDMGHRQVLEAVAKLKNENVFTVLMGHGATHSALHDEMTALVEKLGLSGRVVMPECSTDWPASFWHTSVVVMPNVAPRGQSRPLLVAQAMGRPTIVTNIGANRELVDTDTAWVVPPDNVSALTKALQGAIRLDINHRLAMADRQREFISTTFPHVKWVEDTFEMYEAVIELAAKKPARNAKAA